MAKFLKVGGAYLNLDNVLSVYLYNSAINPNLRIAKVYFVGHNEEDNNNSVEHWGEEAEAIEHWLMSNADGVEKAEIDS